MPLIPLPSTLPPGDPDYNNNVLSSPSSGVWQKTGWNTFSGMILDMEYHNGFNPALSLPPDLSVFQFGKLQFTGRLSPSGDAMTFNALLTRYNPQGEKTSDMSFNGTGTRIPLEILPNTSDTLPLPSVPTTPAP